ncbi:hypothetical protein ACSQ67_011750 [Phaseolus vulgaris]
MNCLKDEELHVAGEESVNGFCLGINPSDIANLVGFVITREPLDTKLGFEGKTFSSHRTCCSSHQHSITINAVAAALAGASLAAGYTTLGFVFVTLPLFLVTSQ